MTYKIGKYPAIIRKIYADGAIGYETEFDSDTDLLETVNALVGCIGGTLRTFEVVYGDEYVSAELRLAECMLPQA